MKNEQKRFDILPRIPYFGLALLIACIAPIPVSVITFGVAGAVKALFVGGLLYTGSIIHVVGLICLSILGTFLAFGVALVAVISIIKNIKKAITYK